MIPADTKERYMYNAPCIDRLTPFINRPWTETGVIIMVKRAELMFLRELTSRLVNVYSIIARNAPSYNWQVVRYTTK